MKDPSEITLAIRGLTEPIDWDSVYESELLRVYNFFLYRVGDRESAQDLTSTTFERAWRLRSRYQTRTASLPTWLFGIARNVLKEHLRNSKTSGQWTDSIFRSEEISSNVDVEKSVQRQQETDRLKESILELPEREQDLISLKYGAGLTNREIARITGLSESNVGSILHRTVKNLRSRLDTDHGR